ncbi:MAG: hypothetical protein ACREDA_11140 [Methylocella sp.]
MRRGAHYVQTLLAGREALAAITLAMWRGGSAFAPKTTLAFCRRCARRKALPRPNHPPGGMRSKNVPASLRGSCKTFPLFPSGGTVLRETPCFLAGTASAASDCGGKLIPDFGLRLH